MMGWDREMKLSLVMVFITNIVLVIKTNID